jgi:hypothetical protein
MKRNKSGEWKEQAKREAIELEQIEDRLTRTRGTLQYNRYCKNPRILAEHRKRSAKQISTKNVTPEKSLTKQDSSSSSESSEDC